MAQHITTAFVLAAGLGTRMRPLTAAVPKPLVRLKGRALIDHVLDRLAAAGIERAVVNVHHLADQIEHHLKGRTRPAIVISDERAALLDTGGGVKRALSALGPAPFIVHNSDSVWLDGVTPNLERMLALWDEERMDALLLLAQVSHSIGYDGSGDFAMQPDGRLVRRAERQQAPFAFAGVSIAHPRLLDETPDASFSLNLPWNRAIARGRLYGVRLDGLWMHIGTPQALDEAERRIDTEGVL